MDNVIFGWGEAFFLAKQVQTVYPEWVTWAGIGVIAYCLFMLTVVNLRAHLRRERRRAAKR